MFLLKRAIISKTNIGTNRRKKQSVALELFFCWAAVMIDPNPTGKALNVKKRQNNRFWKINLLTNNFELKELPNNFTTIVFLASRHI